MSKYHRKPQKWTQVYPQGTPTGNEEQKFFIALGRHKEFKWRSVASIAKESGLTKERVEQIIAKYSDPSRYDPPLVYQSPKNEDNFGYWERVPEMLDDDHSSITSKDQKARIDKSMGVPSPTTPQQTGGQSVGSAPTPSKVVSQPAGVP